jgi:hypothetical protein
MPQLIELAQNRKLTLRNGGLRYGLIIPPISAEAWFEQFFNQIRCAVTGDRVQTDSYVDVESAAANLAEKAAVGFEGYPSLEGVADWQSKIPLSHLMGYGHALLEVVEPEGADRSAKPSGGFHVVRIEALWDSTPAGAMCRHRKLVHTFTVPGSRQRDRFRRSAMKMRRTTAVTHRGSVDFLAPENAFFARAQADIYDELIASVDGYAVNGEPLSNDRAQIIIHMDTYHKVRAANFLFSRDFEQLTSFARRWR